MNVRVLYISLSSMFVLTQYLCMYEMYIDRKMLHHVIVACDDTSFNLKFLSLSKLRCSSDTVCDMEWPGVFCFFLINP